MAEVRAKKHLGQHFLTDKGIALRIVEALEPTNRFSQVLEVGPGMGILTEHLIRDERFVVHTVDIDEESIAFLSRQYPELEERLLHADFLRMDLATLFVGPLAIIGNFPYNISSQILFKVLENRNQVVEVVGMFQKEVAERCTAQPGTKEYGILSVFLQAYYRVNYLFTVKAGSFNPPPKVLSGVIRLERNEVQVLPCNESLFWKVVKAGFNQRRKTLRNALSMLLPKDKMGESPLFDLRAERLSVADFVVLTNIIDTNRK
ncbi:16S rRNA (adenine(1518)-N(6)/adenine(1519)-N(6))-dimethyltransferase RsmA [Olivibacter sitiensis]|uniref:16S rRNA (adenine(1518)-N(6)/adenine(1519)-N(6))- dimethyltransferase RsmA n=1 Tax=Olivibacter sitiensis TaxID=376470 RepID=UPI0004122352|nr:16S rRNA (adenine(1518)-N(6)/adenine(1519)-N(6))-dimethyltransferase RsmA [Olivibacter sitiensis]